MNSAESLVASLRGLRAAVERGNRPAKLSYERFDESHELFEQSSNQQQLILQWLKDLVLSNYASLDPLKILSVGCGSGILDNPLIQSIAADSKSVEYTGVDPNPVACQRFREEFDNLQLSNVRLKLWEQDVESLASEDRFHIIHVVHSLYYFKDPAQTLDVLLNLLAPGGIVAVVQAPEAELNRLSKCFWAHHEENGIWFSCYLADHLKKNGLTFRKHNIDGEVDVARCFQADCPRGELILDFITQSVSSQLDEDVHDLCLSYLRSISRCENGNILVAHPADAFVISSEASPS